MMNELDFQKKCEATNISRHYKKSGLRVMSINVK